METKKLRRPKFSAQSIESESSLTKTNQFTYVERATQTYNKYQKDREIQTEPPKKIEFKANLSQWIIYDKYMAFEESKDKAEEIENRTDNIVTKPRRRRFLEPKEHNARELMQAKMIRCGKILERMVNQNNFDEIAIGNEFNWNILTFICVQIITSTRMSRMSKGRRGPFFLCGPFLIRRQRQWRSLHCVGIVDTKTFSQLVLDHVS